MRKILLSAFLILVFAGYVIHKQLESAPKVVNLPPAGTPLIMPTATPTPQASGQYKDGTYLGDVTDAFYGNVQVQAVISGGRITDVVFLDYPSDRKTSQEINTQAMPLLKQEAIQAQSANVDIVSGATQTSLAFMKSLQAALNKAL